MKERWTIGGPLGIGMIVHAVSMRSQDERPDVRRLSLSRRETRLRHWPYRPAPTAEELGFARDPEPLQQQRDLLIYVPVLTAGRPELRTRLASIAGLLLVVTAAALAVALALYRLGHALNQTIEGFVR